MPEPTVQPQVPPTPIALPQTDAYGVFCGNIDQDAASRIFKSLSNGINNGIKRVHLLFQTLGGSVGDGIAIYNFFRNLPLELTIYNVGSVQSIGVIIFLGAQKRKTAANATFLIHRTTTGAQYAKSSVLRALAESTALDDKRTEDILRAHVNLPKKTWRELDCNDVTLSGEDAIEVGIAEEIGEFSPPKGILLTYV